MLASSRIVYGRAFRVTPVWLWWAQRLSGIALGPLVALHVIAPAWAPATVGTLLLAVVALHGYCGLRRIAPAARRASAGAAIAWLWTAMVVACGLAVLVSL